LFIYCFAGILAHIALPFVVELIIILDGLK
jgi:hypothetical protein